MSDHFFRSRLDYTWIDSCWRSFSCVCYFRLEVRCFFFVSPPGCFFFFFYFTVRIHPLPRLSVYSQLCVIACLQVFVRSVRWFMFLSRLSQVHQKGLSNKKVKILLTPDSGLFLNKLASWRNIRLLPSFIPSFLPLLPAFFLLSFLVLKKSLPPSLTSFLPPSLCFRSDEGSHLFRL